MKTSNPKTPDAAGRFLLPLMEVAAMAQPHAIGIAPHNNNSTLAGLAATVQSGISHHDVNHGPTNDNTTATILRAISSATVARQEL